VFDRQQKVAPGENLVLSQKTRVSPEIQVFHLTGTCSKLEKVESWNGCRERIFRRLLQNSSDSEAVIDWENQEVPERRKSEKFSTSRDFGSDAVFCINRICLAKLFGR
jgi:hypothetical protein